MSTLEPTSKREPLLHLLAKHHLPELQFERWLPPANEDRAWTSTPLRITEEALHELSIYDSLELEPSTRNSIHECIEDALPFLNLDDSPNEEQGGQSYHDVMRWMENETRTAKHLHKLSGHSGGAFFFVSSHLAEPVTHVANLVLSGANGRLVTSPENIDKALMIIKLSWTEDSLRTFTELPPRRPLLLLMFRSNEEVPPEEVDSLIRDLGSGAIGVGQDGSAYMMGSPDQPRHERPEKCRVLDQVSQATLPFNCSVPTDTAAAYVYQEERRTIRGAVQRRLYHDCQCHQNRRVVPIHLSSTSEAQWSAERGQSGCIALGTVARCVYQGSHRHRHHLTVRASSCAGRIGSK